MRKSKALLLTEGMHGMISQVEGMAKALNTEYMALAAEIERVAQNTQFNGTDILDNTPGSGGSVTFQVGANASQTVAVVAAAY